MIDSVDRYIWRGLSASLSAGGFQLYPELFVHVPLACPSRQPSPTSDRILTHVTVAVVRQGGVYRLCAPRVRLGTTACCNERPLVTAYS